MNEDNLLFAFALTTLAGLSTAIGAAIAFFAKGTIKQNNLVIHKSKAPMTLTQKPIRL